MAATTHVVVAHLPLDPEHAVFRPGADGLDPKYNMSEWRVEIRGIDAARQQAAEFKEHFRSVAIHTVSGTEYLPEAQTARAEGS